MSDFAVARQFAEAVLAACNVLETADAAEERARLANIAVANANNAKRQAEIDAAAIKAESDKYVRDNKAWLERAGGEEKGKLAAEKAEHDRGLAQTKQHIERASETLEGINRQIGEKRTEHDGLVAAITRMKALAAEMAGKL